jgi:hypothetical protein
VSIFFFNPTKPLHTRGKGLPCRATNDQMEVSRYTRYSYIELSRIIYCVPAMNDGAVGRLRACILVGILFICRLSIVLSQDYSLYGLYEYAGTPITPRKTKEIYSKCFQGLGFTSCSPNLPEDDVILGYDMAYYTNLASIQGQFYCVQCCGDPPNYVDTWDLSCTMDVSSLSALTAQFGFELRLARKRTATDNGIVRCPFTRKQCDFSTDFAPACDRSNDTYLHGYTLTVEVEELDSNFAFWRGVRSCEFSDIDERSYPLEVGQSFREKLILKHKPVDTFDSSDLGKVLVIVFSCSAVAYIALYFLRRKRCEYCQGKLVLSPRLCYKCICVGAQPPDPILLKALEERGYAMQGKMPERLGCLQRGCVGCLRCCYHALTCKCCCRPCAWFCRNCCCCCKCCHCCEPRAPERIVPDDINAMSIDQLTAIAASIKMERGDNVELFDGDLEAVTEQPVSPAAPKPAQNVDGKTRSKRINEVTFEAPKIPEKKRKPSITTAASERHEKADKPKKKSKNPNALDYPREVIYKAVKHPSVY